MYEIKVETCFSAAHRLRDYEGDCERLHGHNYRLEIVLAREQLDDLGMVMDLQELKSLAARIVQRLDHRYLNEVAPFDKLNPTTEQIGRYIGEQVACRLPGSVRLRKVTCWESDRSSASYVPDEAEGAPASWEECAR